MVSSELRPALTMTLLLTVLTGILYPLLVTGIAAVAFPAQAGGSLVVRADGTIVGSRLIAQAFTADRYFHPRPSAAGDAGYDAAASSGSNLGPLDRRLIDRVAAAAQRLKAENPGTPIPVDLVTTSGSGLDPDLTPAAARFQVPRVAHARGLEERTVLALVGRQTQGRQWGVLGEPRVNVLALDLALDALPAR